MHGRPRQKQAGPPDSERVKAAQKKAALFGQLSKEVLDRRADQRYDPESMGLAAKLLELHPEVYTVWNFRREALQPVLEAGGEAAVAAVQGELALTERALQKNPKSYATWHHRKWLVAKGFCSLERELQLVGQLLEADERNFHGWGYRRFVVQLMGTPAARELEYAEHKINQNFSNYSAWHSRTVLLPVLHGSDAAAEQQQQQGGEPVSEAAEEAAAATLGAALASAARLDVAAAAAQAGGPAEPAAGRQGAAAAAVGEQQAAQQASGQPHGEAQPAGSGAGGPAQRGQPSAQRQRPPAQQPPAGASSASAAVPKEALDEEYELVKQAFFTEPEDQSGWFYHRWLLGCSLAHWEAARGTAEEPGERAALLAVLQREQQTCRELLEVEPDAKWPLLTLTRLQEVEQQVRLGSSSDSDQGAAEGAATAAAPQGGLAAEVAEGYARLIELDPLRKGYYEDARDGRAHVVAKPAAAAAAAVAAPAQ